MIERLFSRFLLGVIKLYRYLISPFLGNRCRFHPSCSEYAVEAIQIHGPFKGFLLGVWRILRCAPWGKGGFDPVPKKEFKKH